MEISLTLFVEGNSRGGRWKPERRENCTFDTCAAAFRGRSSFAKWRVPLSLSVAAICQCRHFLRRRWRQFSKLEAVIAPYFIASSKQRRQHELRGPFLAVVKGRRGWHHHHHQHQRPTESRVMLYDRILPSFLPLRSYKMPHHQRGFAV